MTTTKPKILITAAAGKTGAPVVEQLLGLGFPVRAMVRQIDERSGRLAALGAEIVVGDLHDLESVRGALAGVERVYFCYPPHLPQLLLAASNMAVAARDAGVRALVNMSQMPAREEATSALARAHWLSESLFDWAGVGAVHVKPSFFAEMLVLFGAESVARDGKLYFPYGQAKHAPVAAADIARVITGVLANPEPHVGARLVVTGPHNLTLTEMADVIGREIGKEVTYVDVPADAWQQILVESVGVPEYLASHLAEVAKDHQMGVFDGKTEVVELVGGQAPVALEDFVHGARALFLSGDVQTVPAL